MIREEKMVEAAQKENILVRMQNDLKRALQKPEKERKWVMVIDKRKCVGCHACTVACIAENKLPPGIIYRPVYDEETGTYPMVSQEFTPRPCMHCDAPPCIPVCPVEPVKATRKQDDNIVVIDYELCIGCGRCVKACPYEARALDQGLTYTQNTPAQQEYELLANFEYGKAWPRNLKDKNPPIYKARKCHFCLHRQAEGQLPMCVTTCIGTANYFGDLNDPESLVAQMAALPNATFFHKEYGTEPTVLYLA
jgi:molybdopterin-containing oxidoreductase family iron-sulfur binding subunit